MVAACSLLSPMWILTSSSSSCQVSGSAKSLAKCKGDDQFDAKKCQGLVGPTSAELPGPPCAREKLAIKYTAVMSPFNTGGARFIKNLPPHGVTTMKKFLTQSSPDVSNVTHMTRLDMLGPSCSAEDANIAYRSALPVCSIGVSPNGARVLGATPGARW